MNRLYALVIAHIAADVVFAPIANAHDDNPIVAILFFALLFSQTGLASVWAGLSGAALPLRGAGLFGSGAFLWLVPVFGLGVWNGGDRELLIMITVLVSVCLGCTTAAFVALKHFGVRIERHTASQRRPPREPLQFSVKHLFLLALVVATTLAVGRAVRTIDQGFNNRWYLLTAFSAVTAVCLAPVMLAALWGCLWTHCGALRVLAALAAAPVAGLIPSYYFRASSFVDWLIFPALIGAAQIVVISSLFVVRSAGYRFRTSRRSDGEPTTPAEPLAAHPLD